MAEEDNGFYTVAAWLTWAVVVAAAFGSWPAAAVLAVLAGVVLIGGAL